MHCVSSVWTLVADWIGNAQVVNEILSFIDTLIVKLATLIARVIMPSMAKIDPEAEEERMSEFIGEYFRTEVEDD